ncbi:uroporphyrinogen-III synthase [Aureimonas sp. AU4]|uniref:uroporphyrinogen-III synthase n=1 Tax=Aureimonas sp. AU4 TaxID=1638163 RepID=UPI000783EBDA|nr:uroporphyrinogen-III synthase [Aureimonas sp. AU4]
MARFLSLRGKEDASGLADLFAARGHEVVVLPLQEVVTLPAALPQGPFAAVLATSAHAAPWLGCHPELCDLPALAVGERTASALRGAGWRDVRVGAGEAGALVDPAREIVNSRALPVLYAAGRVRRPETEAAFAAAGLVLRTVEVYDAPLRAPRDREVEALLREGSIDGVLLLSLAQACCFAAFSGLLRPARLLCLSARIRDALPLMLRAAAEVANAPTLAALAELAASGQEARRMP